MKYTKTCTDCGKKQKIAEFRENLGEFGVIENNLCRTCIKKAVRVNQGEADLMIQRVAERVFA